MQAHSPQFWCEAESEDIVDPDAADAYLRRIVDARKMLEDAPLEPASSARRAPQDERLTRTEHVPAAPQAKKRKVVLAAASKAATHPPRQHSEDRFVVKC